MPKPQPRQVRERDRANSKAQERPLSVREDQSQLFSVRARNKRPWTAEQWRSNRTETASRQFDGSQYCTDHNVSRTTAGANVPPTRASGSMPRGAKVIWEDRVMIRSCFRFLLVRLLDGATSRATCGRFIYGPKNKLTRNLRSKTAQSTAMSRNAQRITPFLSH